MAQIILVHGGNVSAENWNLIAKRETYPAGTLLGGNIWHQIAHALKTKGHHVYTPTLDNEYQYNLSHHIRQIGDIITSNQLSEVTLVAHSYGGMVITGVANTLLKNINQLVYIDAALPSPQQSLFDLLQLSNIDPSQIIEGAPPAYTEKIDFNPENLKKIKKAYLLCTASEFIRVGEMAKQKIQQSHSPWHYEEINATHLPMASHPQQVTAFLQHLITTL